MRELADNISDIAQNSVSAKASLLEITVTVNHAQDWIEIVFRDNGCGMSEEMVKTVAEPFTTTRKTRKVGLGLAFLKQTATMTGGDFSIESELGRGTTVSASFGLSNLDRPPMGDVAGAWYALVIMNTHMDFVLVYDYDDRRFEFDTRVIRATIEPLKLDDPEISAWIKDCLYQEIKELHGGNFQ